MLLYLKDKFYKFIIKLIFKYFKKLLDILLLYRNLKIIIEYIERLKYYPLPRIKPLWHFVPSHLWKYSKKGHHRFVRRIWHCNDPRVLGKDLRGLCSTCSTPSTANVIIAPWTVVIGQEIIHVVNSDSQMSSLLVQERGMSERGWVWQHLRSMSVDT